MNPATHATEGSVSAPVLYMALELSNKTWRLAFSDGAKPGLRLTFTDAGPGIPDIDQALKDGYSTGPGMGLGLGGSKRLVNDFKIVSRPGEGTTVTITRWRT